MWVKSDPLNPRIDAPLSCFTHMLPSCASSLRLSPAVRARPKLRACLRPTWRWMARPASVSDKRTPRPLADRLALYDAPFGEPVYQAGQGGLAEQDI